MEPVSIALICAASLGTVVVIIAFIRQLLISRDKKLNDQAQNRALSQEANKLQELRTQMQSGKRFEAHYMVLGANKDAILFIDKEIDSILSKKMELVDQYSKFILKESTEIISSSQILVERKEILDKLRAEMDAKMKFYDTELVQFQERRGKLWDANLDFEKHLLEVERSRNVNVDEVYKQHSAILEKVFIRHIDDMDNVTTKGIEAATMTFKEMLMVPIQFLMQFFGRGMPGISLVHTRVETKARTEVESVQQELNSPKENTVAADDEVQKVSTVSFAM